MELGFLGKGFVVLGSLICINPYFILYGAPLNLIGIVIVIDSNNLLFHQKLKWIIYPPFYLIVTHLIIAGLIYISGA